MLSENQSVADPAVAAPPQKGILRLGTDLGDKIDEMENFITKDLRELGKSDSILNAMPKHLTDMFTEWDSADKTPAERKMYEELKASITDAHNERSEVTMGKLKSDASKMEFMNAIKGIQKGVQSVNTLLTQAV